ncbi:MAG: Gfo/Idh/MocA family oxidoreductase [Thiolinea sp.]
MEQDGQKQAEWRTDPARSGAGGCVGDIGTHAWHLAGFVSGLETAQLAADLDTFVEGRRVDDNVHVMLRFKSPDGGRPAKGLLWASQVAAGHENGLRLRVYGEQGSLEWVQADPNYLWHAPLGEPRRLITRGGVAANDAAGRVTRPRRPSGRLSGRFRQYL